MQLFAHKNRLLTMTAQNFPYFGVVIIIFL
jgi:hypothetical protein